MKKVVVFVLSGFVLAAAAAGCSSDPVEPFPSADSFCQAKSEAECKQVAGSCGATIEACKIKRAGVCNATATSASSTRKYASAQVQACLDKTNEIYAKRNITPDDLKAQADVCDKVFQGSAAKLAACTVSADCSGALVCDEALKVCAEKSSKALGDGCANPGDVCPKGSFCNAAAIKQCVAKKLKAEQCGANLPCAEDFRCGAGSCEDRLGVGATCTKDEECATAAPLCDVGKKQCVPGLQLSIGTAACKDFGGT